MDPFIQHVVAIFLSCIIIIELRMMSLLDNLRNNWRITEKLFTQEDKNLERSVVSIQH